MSDDVFANLLPQIPAPFDPIRAQRTLAALGEGPDGCEPRGRARAVLEAMFGNSPFLARAALRERAFLRDLIVRSPQAALETAEAMARAASDAGDMNSAMTSLRCAKRQAAMAIALADIAGLWDVGAVTQALTRFADICVGSALRFARRIEHPGSTLPAHRYLASSVDDASQDILAEFAAAATSAWEER